MSTKMNEGDGFVSAIILAAGGGERFGQECPKQFIKIAGRRVIEHTIAAIEASELIDEIIVVSHEGYVELVRELISKNRFSKVTKVVIGGNTRQQSSWYGLQACSMSTEYVIIHDAARPLVTGRIISEAVEGLADAEGTNTVIGSTDTLVRGDRVGACIQGVADRSTLFRGQSPQGFRFQLIRQAHEMACREGYDGATDDCGLILRYGLGRVRLVPGDETNIKITHPIDAFIADRLFQIRHHAIVPRSADELRSLLQGQVLAVFGAGGGIGKATVEIAQMLGMRVYGWDMEVDVRDYEAVSEALQELHRETGRIDHVVNGAGVLRMAHVELADMEVIAQQIAINLIGSINVCKAATRFLRESRGHVILFASSSYTRGRPGYTAYSASKAGVVNFVQGFSDEMSDYGVKVNCINPERTKTPMRVQNFGNEEEGSLLRPDTVAIQCVNVLTCAMSGSVIDVRKDEEATIRAAFGRAIETTT